MRGARNLRSKHERVRRIDDRGLGRAPEQLGRVGGVPLVELVVAGDEHRRGPPSGASRPPGLLAHRRERAREAVEHHRVEAADVDAELQRVRCRDAEQAAVAEPALELAPLLGQVAGAVRGDAVRPAGDRRRQAAPGLGRDELGAAPAAGERQRGSAVAHEPGEQLRGLRVRRAPPGVLVEQRTLPEPEAPLRLRGAVVVDRGDRLAAQRLRELRRVADRRAREAERRVRAVVRAHRAAAGAARARRCCRRCRAASGARRRRSAGAASGTSPSGGGTAGCPGAASPGS